MGPIDPPTRQHFLHILSEHRESILQRWQELLEQPISLNPDKRFSTSVLATAMEEVRQCLATHIASENNLSELVLPPGNLLRRNPDLLLRGEEAIGEILTAHLAREKNLYPARMRQQVNLMFHQLISPGADHPPA